VLKVGSITIEAVSDGCLRAPPTALFNRPSKEDWAPHRDLLDEEGRVVFEMGGFLVRDGRRTVLVDAGLGPYGERERAGTFMENLGALGVAPADITDVVLTHLHFDHVGWASDGEQPLFPNATYRCHEADWDFFLGADPYDDSMGVNLMGGRRAIELLPAVKERTETWTGDVTLLPGIDVRTAPGHTPGSTVVTVSSGDERALLLGDVVHCPAELLEDDWEMISDVDKELARRTRVALAREFEGSDVPMAASHFPDLRFGRLLPGSAMRRWVFD
jgi:glyoxylase-like metal-dependent hydrolase (beta-lactamase superfamily II)